MHAVQRQQQMLGSETRGSLEHAREYFKKTAGKQWRDRGDKVRDRGRQDMWELVATVRGCAFIIKVLWRCIGKPLRMKMSDLICVSKRSLGLLCGDRKMTRVREADRVEGGQSHPGMSSDTSSVCKGPDSKRFQLCRPHRLCCNYSTCHRGPKGATDNM